MLKKVCAALLAVIMMVSMVCTISLASAEDYVATLVAEANKETVKRGEDVVFTVSVETTDVDLSGLAIDVVADSDLVFKSKEAVKTTEMPHVAEGTAFAWMTGDGKLDFDGAIATYTYTAKAEADLADVEFTVFAIEACYDETNDTVDVVDEVADGVASVEIVCAHKFEGAWTQPAEGTAKEDAKHSRTCAYDDCDEPEYAACDFVETGVTKHTEEQDGATHYECTVCGYECTTPIPAGHDIVIRYKAADVANGVDGYWENYCTICGEAIGGHTPIAAELPGKDVKTTDWFYSYCAYAKAAGLMAGDNNGNFNPNKEISRAELAVVLANLYYGAGNVPAYDPNGIVFDDSTEHWAKGYIQAIADAGLTAGYSEGGKKLYKPENKITTTEIIIMFKALCEKKGLGNYQFNPAVTYSDRNKADSWALSYIDWAASTGFMTGDTNGNLDPKGNYTRLRVAVLLKNFDIALRGVEVVA